MVKKRFVKPAAPTKKHLARLEIERRQVLAIRYISAAVILTILLVVLYGILNVTFIQQRQPVAIVGGEEISTREFQLRVRLERQQLIGNYIQTLQLGQLFGFDVSSELQQIEFQLNVPSILGQQVLDSMIGEILIVQEAKRRGLTVSPEQVEASIRAALDYFPEGTPTPTQTPAFLGEPTLSPTQLALVTVTPTFAPPPTSTPDSQATATAVPVPTLTATPFTEEGYQQVFRENLAQFQHIKLTEADMRKLFEFQEYRLMMFAIITADVPAAQEQVWARHILVDDQETALDLRRRLLEGEDWGTLAVEFSNDPGSKDFGGDLGWFPRGRMVAEFEEAAFSLAIAEISQPVQTNFGFHLIQVIGRGDRPLDTEGYRQAREAVFRSWLQDLRLETEVIIFDYWLERIPTDPDLNSALMQAFGQ
jgi:peptidyl-prolyl cis-trans isomerase D